MYKAPHVRLAIMTNAEPAILQRAVDSARHLIDSACILIAPKAFDRLPTNGFGYLALETKVVQRPWEGHTTTRTALLHAAEDDHWVDWILMMDADDVLQSGARLPEFDRDVDAYLTPVEEKRGQDGHRGSRYGHLMRARRGFYWKGTDPRERKMLQGMNAAKTARHDHLVLTNVPDAPRAGIAP